MINVAAIVLAAGKGERIGTPKWKLPVNGTSFLVQVVNRLQLTAVSKIVVVSSPEDHEGIAGLSLDAELAINPNPERGVLSSIRTGVQHVLDADGVLIMPVDHPLVRAETLVLLVESFRANVSSVIKPMHDNRAGHPVIVPLALARQIPDHDMDGGLRAFINSSGVPLVRVSVNDPGILRNINAPGDL